MRVVADDRALAAVAGIDTGRVVLATWVLSGLLAALAGVLAGLVHSTFDPNFGFTLLLPVFAAVVLGGIGTPTARSQAASCSESSRSSRRGKGSAVASTPSTNPSSHSRC